LQPSAVAARESDKFKPTHIDDDTMTCKEICIKYKATRPHSGGRYSSGQKRCQICDIFLKWEGLLCTCCRYRLRIKPRNRHWKAKLMEDEEEKRY